MTEHKEEMAVGRNFKVRKVMKDPIREKRLDNQKQLKKGIEDL